MIELAACQRYYLALSRYPWPGDTNKEPLGLLAVGVGGGGAPTVLPSLSAIRPRQQISRRHWTWTNPHCTTFCPRSHSELNLCRSSYPIGLSEPSGNNGVKGCSDPVQKDCLLARQTGNSGWLLLATMAGFRAKASLEYLRIPRLVRATEEGREVDYVESDL